MKVEIRHLVEPQKWHYAGPYDLSDPESVGHFVLWIQSIVERGQTYEVFTHAVLVTGYPKK